MYSTLEYNIFQMCERLNVKTRNAENYRDCPPGTLNAIGKSLGQQKQVHAAGGRRSTTTLGKKNGITRRTMKMDTDPAIPLLCITSRLRTLAYLHQHCHIQNLDIFYTGMLPNRENHSSDAQQLQHMAESYSIILSTTKQVRKLHTVLVH